MAIEIRSGHVIFPSGTGLQTIKAVQLFSRAPRACWVSLAGYKAVYDSSDHHMKTLQVELSTQILQTDDGPTVYVVTRLLLRDRNADDRFSGWVDYVLFADMGSPLAGEVLGPAIGRFSARE